MSNADDFLQNGILFEGTTGRIVWTNEAQGLLGQDPFIPIPYVASHDYWFVISGDQWGWQLCQYDTSDINTYDCEIDDTSAGSTVKTSENLDTSIWFENFNTTSAWANNFPALKMEDAEYYINGFNTPWGAEHLHTAHSCSISYPTNAAMSGSLVSGGIAYFNPSDIPLECVI